MVELSDDVSEIMLRSDFSSNFLYPANEWWHVYPSNEQILNIKILIYIWWRTVFDLISEHALISGHPPFFLQKNIILIFVLFLIFLF